MKKKRSWLPIVAGIAVLTVSLVIAGLFVLAAVVRDRIDVDRTQNAASAAVEFEKVRQQFPGATPMLTYDGRTAALSETARQGTSTARLDTLAVLAWNPEQEELVRVSLPFWLLRLQGKPFILGDMVTSFEDRSLQLTAEDIERHGPGIVLDFVGPDGTRVLVWTQ